MILPAGIGDTLMATPALRVLSDRYPGASIDLLVLHSYVADAFRWHPLVARITSLPVYLAGRPERCFRHVRNRREALRKALWYFPDVVLRMVGRAYDLGVNLGLDVPYHHLGNALMFAAGVPVRIGVRDHGLGLLTAEAGDDLEWCHRADHYLTVLSPLGIRGAATEYEYPLRETERDAARMHIASLRGSGRSAVVALNPGGSLLINSRRWPAEHFLEAGRYLTHEMNALVLVVGGQGDEELCSGLASGIGEGAYSLAGRTSFRETAAILSLCDLCITNDTGILHLADAVQTRWVVVVFGPTPADLLAPRSGRVVVMRSGLPCAPCLGSVITSDSPRCPHAIKEECLWQVTPQQVIAKVRELLPEGKSLPAGKEGLVKA